MTRFWGVEESEKKNKPSFISAFTLAEMMVVMLILSIVLAAMAPVMTTRYKSKPNDSSPWKYEANNKLNAYFGTNPSVAMIGQNQYTEGTDISAKLLINLGNSTNFLGFKSGDANLGRLQMGANNLLLGNLASGSLGVSAVAFGKNVESGSEQSTAIGITAKANANAATAVGSNVTASGISSLAVGTSSNATADNSLAIGNAATGSGASAVAIGQGATGSGASSIAIGQSARVKEESDALSIGHSAFTAGANTIVIGSNATIKFAGGAIEAVSTTNSQGSIVIGNGATSALKQMRSSKGVIAIGDSAKILDPVSDLDGDGVIAIGKNASAQYNGAIALGQGAIAKGYYHRTTATPNGLAGSIAIGDNAQSLTYHSIAIGKDANIAEVEASPGNIAIGNKASINSSSGGATVIGTNSKSEGSYSVAFGANANRPNITSSEVNYWSNEAGGYSAKSNETYTSGNASVAIGSNTYAKGSNSIAIGGVNSFQTDNGGWKQFFTYSGGGSSIAIGSGAQSAGDNGVAIGKGAAATGNYSIAIGENSRANAERSVAIGRGVVNNRFGVIQLGDTGDTVYIPGNLVAKGTIILGSDQHKTFIYTNDNDDGRKGYNLMYRADEGTNHRRWESLSDRNGHDYEIGGQTYYLLDSDRRLKYVGKENKSGLDKIRQLKIFNYTYKKDTTKTPHVGVIAQDLQKVFPNAVKKGADGFLTIRMEDMFYAVINAIKELDAKYQAQEKRINELEKRIEKLEAKVK